MSLINDALKRAKQAQPANLAPADGPSLRPVESPRYPVKPDYLMFALIAVILLLAGVLALQWSRSGAVTVRARTITTDVLPEAAHVAPVPTPAIIQPSVALVAAVAPAQVPAAPTVTTVAVEPAKPVPLVYKLRSIFYFPKNPSANINGKTVHEGSLVSGARVLTIRQESVIIVTTSGQTNLLELPQ